MSIYNLRAERGSSDIVRLNNLHMAIWTKSYRSRGKKKTKNKKSTFICTLMFIAALFTIVKR